MSRCTPGPWTAHPNPESRPNWDVYAGARQVAADCRRQDAQAIAALPDLIAACKMALPLAWEVGTETNDGVHTLLPDSRGDLWRQLSSALAKAGL